MRGSGLGPRASASTGSHHFCPRSETEVRGPSSCSPRSLLLDDRRRPERPHARPATSSRRRGCCRLPASTRPRRCSPTSRSAPATRRGQVAARRARVPDRRLRRRGQDARQGPRRCGRRHGRADPQARQTTLVGDRRLRRAAVAEAPLHHPVRARKDAAIAPLAGEVLDAAWEVIGDDLGDKPADPIRVELLGSPADLAVVAAHRGGD